MYEIGRKRDLFHKSFKILETCIIYKRKQKVDKESYIVLLSSNIAILAIFRNAVCLANSRHVCENCLLSGIVCITT